MSQYTSTTEAVQKIAADLLSEKKVDVVIGYGMDRDDTSPQPYFLRDPGDAHHLIFDERCFNNLAVYLPRKEIRALGKAGIVVKGCDLKAINVLLREFMIEREDVHIIGMCCSGVGEPTLQKCTVCDVHNPTGCDVVVGEAVDEPPVDAEAKYAEPTKMDVLPVEEKWAFWEKKLKDCIRCYACRQVCPLCYCKRCIVEKSVPQWVETSPHLRGNISWNVVRAFHLTGRCIGCGECERVCPVGIPLGLLNGKMAKLVEEWFSFTSGTSPDEEAPFTTWKEEDFDRGIL